MTETDETELALAQLAADVVNDLSTARILELAAAGQAARVMGPREHEVARHANPDYQKLRGIPPLDPAAGKWCSYCGNSDPGQLVPGPDHEHGFNDWMCRDELDRHCQARHERRWPPRPDLAEPVLMKLARQADEADAARLSRQQPAARQEPAAQQETMPGWQAVPGVGTYNTKGDFLPALPQFNPLAHLISGGAPMPHTIAGGAHMGHTIAGMARSRAQGQPGVLSGQQDGRQAQREPQQAGREIPAEGLSPGQAEALYGQRGVDVAMVPGKEAAAAPQRPARVPRDRYGRRRYPQYRGR